MNEVDNKRATGRTTRMVLKAAELLVADKTKSVTLVGHDHHGVRHLECCVKSLLSARLVERIYFSTYSNYINNSYWHNDSRVLVDHHCYYKAIVDIQKQMDAVKQQWSTYD